MIQYPEFRLRRHYCETGGYWELQIITKSFLESNDLIKLRGSDGHWFYEGTFGPTHDGNMKISVPAKDTTSLRRIVVRAVQMIRKYRESVEHWNGKLNKK